MSLFDVFRGRRYKNEAAMLRQELERCRMLLTPELLDARSRQDTITANIDSAHYEIELLQAEHAKLAAGFAKEIDQKTKLSAELDKQIVTKKEELVSLDDEALLQEFGLYEPRFDFMTVDQYKQAISRIRSEQKHEVRRLNIAAKNSSWIVNNSKSKGRKMVSDITRLLIRAFNSECDEIVRKVKFSNIDASVNAIQKSAQAISKLGIVIGINISQDYVQLKIEEAYLAFEYAQFKQREKERQRELREQEREERRLLKEIAEQRKKLDKERQQYETALVSIEKQLAGATGEKLAALNAKKLEIVEHIGEVAKATTDIDYREANQRAGYVYIISNIGSFGENVYKIGMTRRLDPMERVEELGDASVPFKFDVHAMIFTEDAPNLEAALHREFEARKVNKVNQRREFFYVTLDEIKDVIRRNYDKTVEFIDIPEAEQYRITQKMNENGVN